MPSSVTGVQTCAVDRKSTRLNSRHTIISYAVFCLKKKTLTKTSPCWNGLIVPRSTVMYGARFEVDVRVELLQRDFEPARHEHPPDRFFFFNDAEPTEIYPLSLHDALPINDTATTGIYALSLHDALPISVVAVSFLIGKFEPGKILHSISFVSCVFVFL